MPFSSISGVRASADPPDRNASYSSEATPSGAPSMITKRGLTGSSATSASTSGLKSLWKKRTFEPAWPTMYAISPGVRRMLMGFSTAPASRTP